MMVLSILALIAAVGLAILFGFIMKDRKLLGLLSALMGAAGGESRTFFVGIIKVRS